MANDPGDTWNVGTHTAIPGPTIGTVKADKDAIRDLATWFSDTLTQAGGLFTAGPSWLVDCSATGGYAGAPLRYDLYAGRTAGKGSALAGPDVTAVGVLPGYAKDDTYLPSAYNLKNTVDTQLSTMYTKLIQDPNSTQMSDGNLYTMVSMLADTLKKVADDYDKGDQQIETDLQSLGSAMQNTLDTLINGLSGSGGKTPPGGSGSTGGS
ncbi:hypothetical protein KGQ20_32135 [Catenulispora sp. NF23]|uniref:Uncharacterized protein n=1 Tax=Catenulispora pinistramenti TaxID=2705254 RepID=A0ABS5KZG2_9ACTN|nr:hypothetical protein [Catenulispora pinistramenti]MBS2537413.1 hypothetical protein [Catenulispora pinistramenti]MBS2551446.1 hypothetical protein [Catenulispora pinistramenti]